MLRHEHKSPAFGLSTQRSKGPQSSFDGTLTVHTSGKSTGGQGVLDLHSFKRFKKTRNKSLYLGREYRWPVSLAIPASWACVSGAGPTSLGCKQSHLGCFPVPCGLGVGTHELKSGYPLHRAIALASPQFPAHPSSKVSYSMGKTFPGMPPPHLLSPLTSLQCCLRGEALVCPRLCLRGQMAHSGGQPLSTQNSASTIERVSHPLEVDSISCPNGK